MAPTFSSIATNPKIPLLSSRHRHAVNLVKCSQQRLHWVSVDRDVKAHILKSLPIDIHPDVVHPMRHVISSAPPTVTPALCLASCQLISGERKHGMAAACCMQLMHVALHVHGRLLGPTGPPHGDFPAGIELMTGDGILALGYEIMSSSRSEGIEPERVVRAIVEVANGTGTKGAEKGGGLSACAAACGAIMGGGSGEEVERMRRVGFYVGLICDGSDRDDQRDRFLSMVRLEMEGFDKKRSGVMEELMDTLMG